MHREASFLGIPREARQHIYDYVMRRDLDYEVVKGYRDGHGDGGCFVIMYRHPWGTLIIPWINLLLTCKSVNTELGAYMSSPVILGDEDNRTYTMDIHGNTRGHLNSATWHRIPCSLSNVDTILVNILFETKSDEPSWRKRAHYRRHVRTFGSDGGPMPIVRQLYQTLNLLLHNGPILNRSHPLQLPPRLKKLEIHTAFKPYRNSGEAATTTMTTGIKHLLKRLRSVGLLHGYVDHVHINDENGHTELKIDAVDNGGVPSLWDREGFEWGHNHDNPVQWEILDEETKAGPGKRV
ncbi:hypothetical protein EKO27_g3174 [Xylaria grammica]|uniref:Uncharacterized protein n=1 Tax=Xylaria grammica TaxID=363999 RepID=A0A439DBZ8_9PEZI|nr:hypothetical protein EKO27_g3174 [Xylaria grammica]